MNKIAVAPPHSRYKSYFTPDPPSEPRPSPINHRINIYSYKMRNHLIVIFTLIFLNLALKPSDVSTLAIGSFIIYLIISVSISFYLGQTKSQSTIRRSILVRSALAVLLVLDLSTLIIPIIASQFPTDLSLVTSNTIILQQIDVLQIFLSIFLMMFEVRLLHSDTAWTLWNRDKETVAHYIIQYRQKLRLDHLTDLESPFVKARQNLNTRLKQVSSFRSKTNFSLIVFVIVFSLYLATELLHQKSLLDSTLSAIVTALIFATSIFIGLYLLDSRNRYIIIPFEVIPKDNLSPELDAIANILTENLVIELQKVSTLLHVRQVENLNLDEEGSNAFFVTSSSDADFFDQLDQAISFELPKTSSVSVGTIFYLLSRFIAKIRIYGKVQRRTNGSIEIQANLSYSSSSSASVNQVIIPERFISEIDSKSIQPIAKSLAISLLLDLGVISHLGTTHSSLEQMLNGFEASSNRDWWLAISHYRQAIQTEESLNNKFGIGYFHLGTAQLFVGNWQDGMESLRTAERDGPLIPELQYMIALALLFIHWAELHKKPNVFNELIARLDTSIELRGEFPEATHLQGVAYYRLGRLKERWKTKWYKSGTSSELDKHSEDFEKDFKTAFKKYTMADAIYSRMLISRNHTVSRSQVSHNQQSNQVEQRIVLSHLIADAHRVLGNYEAAKRFYRESLVLQPENLRTLADISKTFCLSKKWHEGERFLWSEAFKDDIPYWNADICIHMGWLLADGTNDTEKYEANDKYNILLEAMQFIDYSIHQRPRYITFYAQTDWFTPFNQATDNRLEIDDATSMLTFIETPFLVKDNDGGKLKQLQLWLAYRIDSFLLFADIPDQSDIDPQLTYIDANWKEDADLLRESLKLQTKYSKFDEFYESFKSHRNEIIGFLNSIQNSKRNQGIYRTTERSRYAKDLYRLWKSASDVWLDVVTDDSIKSVVKINDIPNVLDRIIVDVLLEITLLTSKMLAECKAYELLLKVAEVGCTISSRWVKWWQVSYKNSKHYEPSTNFIFNARVFRYQQASLHGWLAYASFFCRQDFLVKSRIGTFSNLNIQSHPTGQEEHIQINSIIRSHSQLSARKWIESIQSNIDISREHIFHHPLVMYMEAKILRHRGMLDEAIDIYEKLIDLISPFDPKQTIGADKFGDYAPDHPTPDVFRHKRTYMRFMERVSGRQQFYTLIDRSRIHMEIADTYLELGKPELRVEHIREAIRWSPYDDQDIDNLIRLANQLNNIERYQEAKAVVDAIYRPSRRLGDSQPSLTKIRTPEMLNCIIDNRSGDYSNALNNAKEIARNFHLISEISFQSPDHSGESEAIDTYLAEMLEIAQKLLDNLIVENPIESELQEHIRSTHNRIGDRVRKMFSVHPRSSESDSDIPIHEMQPTESNTKYLLDLLLKIAESQSDDESDQLSPLSLHSKILRVFSHLNDKSQLNDIENRIRETQFNADENIRAGLLQTLWESRLESTEVDKYFDFIVVSQIMNFLSKEASKSLSQLAELCNVMAYSRAQTGLHLQHAFLDSACAVVINGYLMHSYTKNSRPRIALADKQAQFCDTFGWVRFRHAMKIDYPLFQQNGEQHLFNEETKDKLALNSKSHATINKRAPHDIDTLNIAEEFFRKGVRYDQERAIIYYHLARVYLAKLEMLWQKNSLIIQDVPEEYLFSYIDAYLVQVLQQHRFAKNYDKFGRLHTQLAWVYNIIMSYKRAWENRKYRGFAGDDSVNMYDAIGIISQD